eukprot:11823062-Ditylum_brightwellii.AAC.1
MPLSMLQHAICTRCDVENICLGGCGGTVTPETGLLSSYVVLILVVDWLDTFSFGWEGWGSGCWVELVVGSVGGF